MRVAYIIEGELNLEQSSSVVKKVLRQTRIWVGVGHSVWVFSMQSGLCLNITTGELTQIGKAYNKHNGAIKKLTGIYWNSFCIYRYLKKLSVDLVYSRLVMYTPFIESIARTCPTVIEINSYDKGEYAGGAYSRFTRFYTLLFGSRFKKLAKSFVFVTYELENLFSGDLDCLPTSCVIGNGYNYSVMPDFIEPQCINKRPKFIFLISPNQPWHGVDRLKAIASHLPEFDFHVVGEDGQDESNIKFSGYLMGSELIQALLEADFGVGTLALDRKHMSEACPLKSREYLYYGLPSFGYYSDPDFMNRSESNDVLFLPLTNIHDIQFTVQQIRKFVGYWQLKSPYKSAVHQSAKQILDDQVKERQRLQFFEKVLAGKS